jgi:hemerythrin-like domain-containing protein
MAKKTTRTSSAADTHDQDALALLAADHETVRELLSELERTTERDAARRTELLLKIGVEVRVHARIEEEIFYPAFKHAAESSADEKLFFEAADEHGIVDLVLPALEGLDPSLVAFGARAKVLKDLIEHHVEEEEAGMFHKATVLLGNELEALGATMQARKLELLKELADRHLRGLHIAGRRGW